MLKADKHLHSNEKLIRLKRNNPFFFGAALTFCDSKINQTILDLLIKNLIQSRYKTLYRKKKSWGGLGGEEGSRRENFSCLSPEIFLWKMSQRPDTLFNVPRHLETELSSAGEENHY